MCEFVLDEVSEIYTAACGVLSRDFPNGVNLWADCRI